MTNEEVKDILHKAFEVYIDSLSGDENFTDKQLEVLTANKIIGKALKKQTPMKPYDKDGGGGCTSHFCSICGRYVGFDVSGDFTMKENHCPTCGQVMLWEVEEC